MSGPGWLDTDDRDDRDVVERADTRFQSQPHRLTLPSGPSLRRAPPPPSPDDAYYVDDAYDENEVEDVDTYRRRAVRGTSGRHPVARRASREAQGDEREWQRERAAPERGGRQRENSSARPLALVLSPEESRALARLEPPEDPPEAPLPAVVPYEARHLRRPRLDTRALALSAARTARSPWSIGRALLAAFAISAAIWTSLAAAGEPSQPLMSFQPGSGTHSALPVASLVRPETQGKRPDLYDSTAQFNDWWDAACSAAVLSEVLTAWGKQGATIGHMIDVMQPDISLDGGLISPHGFERGAETYSYRADISWHLTYKQMLYLTNVLGLPVIVNVRISYGYYQFFAGGHFLVMTGGDDQGLTIVDSSEYYIHYLPIDTFMSMFTGMTTVVVPKDYTYTI
jgi:hypothetical protein